MPMLDLRLAQECAQLRQGYRTKVPGSSGNTYSVYVRGEDSHCTCPGHKFHGKCKHVTAARAEMCTWSSTDDEPQSLQQNVEMRCPRCDGDTELVKVGF
jgi:uncharacterized Zn finger protein